MMFKWSKNKHNLVGKFESFEKNLKEILLFFQKIVRKFKQEKKNFRKIFVFDFFQQKNSNSLKSVKIISIKERKIRTNFKEKREILQICQFFFILLFSKPSKAKPSASHFFEEINYNLLYNSM